MLQGSSALVGIGLCIMLAEFSWVHFRTGGCHSEVTCNEAKVIFIGEDISESQDEYYCKNHYLMLRQRSDEKCCGYFDQLHYGTQFLKQVLYFTYCDKVC
jgi:hypothetical protein